MNRGIAEGLAAALAEALRRREAQYAASSLLTIASSPCSATTPHPVPMLPPATPAVVPDYDPYAGMNHSEPPQIRGKPGHPRDMPSQTTWYWN